MEERKALIMKKEEGGDTMMDLWRTGRDRLKERVELLDSHFKELRGLFFLASCGAISYFFSAAVSEEITEMESQRGALYGSNRDQTTGLNPLNYAIHRLTQPLPLLSPPPQIWEQVLDGYHFYHSICCLLIIHLRATAANGSCELYLAIQMTEISRSANVATA